MLNSGASKFGVGGTWVPSPPPDLHLHSGLEGSFRCRGIIHLRGSFKFRNHSDSRGHSGLGGGSG